MKTTDEAQRMPTKKLVGIVVTVSICVLFVVSFITLVSNIIKYNGLVEEKERLEGEIYDCEEDIEELEYWIKAPMDDEYIMKFAREKLELFRADEIVFTNDQEN